MGGQVSGDTGISQLVMVGQVDVNPQVYHQLQDSNAARQNNKVWFGGYNKDVASGG